MENTHSQELGYDKSSGDAILSYPKQHEMHILNAGLALFALSVAKALSSPPCSQICAPLCLDSSVVCLTACTRTCNGIPHSTDESGVYFSSRIAFELPGDEIITSADSAFLPINDDFYMTTLNGKLYRYTMSTSLTAPLQLLMLYRIPIGRLDQTNGKGLYSVAVDQRYLENSKLYLAYSSKVEPTEDRRRYIPGSKDDPNLLSTLTLDHYTSVQEIVINGLSAEPGPIIKKVEQYTGDAIGNWLGSMHPNPTIRKSTNRLVLATGGNAREDGLIAMFNAHLSSMVMMSENGENVVRTEVWSSAIRRPTDCSITYTRAGIVRCLLETEDHAGHANGTVLYALKQGTNYGSEAFRKHCELNNLGCKQRIEDVMNRDGLLAFPSTDCPVRTMHVYTGSRTRMPSFFGKVLAVRESCFRPEKKSFSEVELLYIDYNAGYGRTRSTPLKLYLQHRFLINTTIIGADNQNGLILAGYSLTSGTVIAQELIPKKAGEFLNL